MTINYRKWLKYAIIVVFFLVLAYAYVPQVLGGKIVNQSDISGYTGMSHEMNTWNSSHPDDPTTWTDSMFSGMPTTSFSASHKGDWTQPIYDLLLSGKRPASYLFISLLGAFLLMLSLGIDPLVAAGGAIAVTFCSYNLQIIQVGHNTKMQAIAFLPWALAAFIFTYNKALEDKKKWWARTLLGSAMFGLAVSFQVKANHQQITYYLALMLVIYALALLIRLLCNKDLRAALGRFFAASALLVVLGVAGIATNSTKLVPLYKYTAQSTRGGSELSSEGGASTGGLDLDYATAWSYGWEELPNLMIPNFNGGSSAGAVNPDKSEVISLLKQAGQTDLKNTSQNLPLYWGPQPFTAGPMYMGAITVFLFLLGLMLCESKDRWWMVACILLAVLLAVGNHFMPFTKFCFSALPFYNKFRTVSMALTMLQVLLPMLGFLALDRILKGQSGKEEFASKGWWAFALTGGVCLLFALFPDLAGSFSSSADSGYPDVLADALRQDRMMLLRGDAVRSLLLIGASFALIWWGYSVPKNAQKTFAPDSEAALARRRTAAVLVCLLVLADMFVVGKRYLNDGDFVTPRAFTNQFTKRPVDELILEDASPSYRVLDLTVNPFSDYHLAYWHKDVGGYSPAKLQRYQELIDRYIIGEANSILASLSGAQTIAEAEEAIGELPVLSALNLKYIIIGGETAPLTNRGAYGNAWFVSETEEVATPAQALSGIGQADLKTTAVLEAPDAEVLASCAGFEGPIDSDVMEMTSYAPNSLTYSYSIAGPRLAVFSEVYYPEGWHASLEDGTEVPVMRADWILRAAVLPEGQHTLTMRFDPPSVSVSAGISRASSILLIVVLLLAAAGAVFSRKKEEE